VSFAPKFALGLWESITSTAAVSSIVLRLGVDADGDTLDLKSSYTTYGGEQPDRIVLRAAVKYKAMILSPAEQAVVEKMRETE